MFYIWFIFVESLNQSKESDEYIKFCKPFKQDGKLRPEAKMQQQQDNVTAIIQLNSGKFKETRWVNKIDGIFCAFKGHLKMIHRTFWLNLHFLLSQSCICFNSEKLKFQECKQQGKNRFFCHIHICRFWYDPKLNLTWILPVSDNLICHSEFNLTLSHSWTRRCHFLACYFWT